MDGIGDTIRVSLTEDPEFEMDPCSRLAEFGTEAATAAWGVEPFEEALRDTHAFARRVGRLPEQQDADGDMDYRNLLHRCALIRVVTDSRLVSCRMLTRTWTTATCCRLVS